MPVSSSPDTQHPPNRHSRGSWLVQTVTPTDEAKCLHVTWQMSQKCYLSTGVVLSVVAKWLSRFHLPAFTEMIAFTLRKSYPFVIPPRKNIEDKKRLISFFPTASVLLSLQFLPKISGQFLLLFYHFNWISSFTRHVISLTRFVTTQLGRQGGSLVPSSFQSHGTTLYVLYRVVRP